jgi:hypothetical protein
MGATAFSLIVLDKWSQRGCAWEDALLYTTDLTPLLPQRYFRSGAHLRTIAAIENLRGDKVPINEFDRLPLAQTCRCIDFDWVSIEDATQDHGAMLIVSGTKHWLNLLSSCPDAIKRGPTFGASKLSECFRGSQSRGS